MIRLLAVDIDGTLFNSRSEIPAANRRAIARALASGLQVVIATGKPYRSIAPLVAELGLTAPQITLNGGAVVKPESRSMVHHQPLAPDQYHAIRQFLKQQGIPSVAYTAEGPYCEQRFAEIDYLVAIREPEPELLPSLARLRDVVKVLTFVAEDDQAQDALIRSFAYPGVQIIRTSNRLLELTHTDTCKGRALKALAYHLGLQINQVAAIGDSENDLGMLQDAGVGIAMGNATDQVKAACQWHVADNDHGGVAEAIERILGISPIM